MAEATINLKLTPSAFDITRRALGSYADNQREISLDATVSPSDRRDAREESVNANNLLGKLNA